MHRSKEVIDLWQGTLPPNAKKMFAYDNDFPAGAWTTETIR
jgi:hypothetical protein